MRSSVIILVFAVAITTVVAPPALAGGAPIGGCFSDTGWDPGIMDLNREEMDSWWKKFWETLFPPDQEPECPEKGTTCGSCESHCLCEYNKQLKDCDGQLCRDGAESEKNACLGGCITDFMDCTS